jgi:anti-sigma factor RsiW
MMQKSCEDIAEKLVDYTDGRLLPNESANVAEHLAECKDCRATVKALQKSLSMATVIWEDDLTEIDTASVPTPRPSRFHWRRYAAAAASILIAIGISMVWRSMISPQEPKPTLAEIERKIAEAGSAARLLAAADLLAKHPSTKEMMERQYRYIVDTYPQTPAGARAKLRIH